MMIEEISGRWILLEIDREEYMQDSLRHMAYCNQLSFKILYS